MYEDDEEDYEKQPAVRMPAAERIERVEENFYSQLSCALFKYVPARPGLKTWAFFAVYAVLWIVLAVVIIAGVNATVGFDSLAGADPAQMEQLTQMSGMDMSMVDTMVSGSSSEMAAVIETLKDLDYGQLIFSFVVYFLLGYLLYASLFAAIGSAVDNEGDSTQLQLPVTVPLLLAFFIAFYAFEAPDSQLAFWGSIIPFTSPIVMLARLPFGVPGWELALSIVLLLLTFVALAYISARIYRVGLLVSGKKTTFSDLWKWLRQR